MAVRQKINAIKPTFSYGLMCKSVNVQTSNHVDKESRTFWPCPRKEDAGQAEAIVNLQQSGNRSNLGALLLESVSVGISWRTRDFERGDL
jgi:hypothetical protein